MKILILDDYQKRHDIFTRKYIGHILTHVFTAQEAINALKTTKFDLIQLDHDLEGFYEYNFSHENSGSTVAEFIRLHLDPKYYPTQIIIHSWNTEGADFMLKAIKEVNIPVEYIPFKYE